jgi:integrase
MAKDKLSAIEIKKAQPRNQDYKLSDGEGLYLLVSKSGAKYWRMKYRFAGKEKVLALGVYCAPKDTPNSSNPISLAKARKLKQEERKILHLGRDPATERKKSKVTTKNETENTFEKVANDWITLKAHTWSPDHAIDVKRSLEAYIFPSVGRLPITQVTSPMLTAILSPLQKRGALETSKRLRQRCSSIFNYGKALGVCIDDPAAPLKEILIPPKKKNLPALTIDEFPEFLSKLRRYNCNYQTMLAMKFMMLTFVRTSELIGARWDEIDFQKKIWNIPKERMKRKRPHFVPLSNQALEVLTELKEMSGNWELVFIKRGAPRKPMSNVTILRVIERLGYKGRMTGHGFRTIASTALNESGLFNPDAIERQLSHEQEDDIRAAYNRAEYFEQRVTMMQWWATQIDLMQDSQPV